MKHILLPTDFSENSKNAIDYALRFFEGSSCHFIFLNVQKPSEFILDDFYTAPADATISETILKDNKKSLELLLAQYKKRFSNEAYTFGCITDYDSFISSISQVVQSENVDLIIMGSNGATGTSEVIFGSNALKVIRNVDCPVLVIPEGYSYTTLETLLFSTHNQKYDSKGIQTLLDIIDFKKPKITILDIMDTTKKRGTASSRTPLKSFFQQKIKIDSYYTLKNIPIVVRADAFTSSIP